MTEDRIEHAFEDNYLRFDSSDGDDADVILLTEALGRGSGVVWRQSNFRFNRG